VIASRSMGDAGASAARASAINPRRRRAAARTPGYEEATNTAAIRFVVRARPPTAIKQAITNGHRDSEVAPRGRCHSLITASRNSAATGTLCTRPSGQRPKASAAGGRTQTTLRVSPDQRRHHRLAAAGCRTRRRDDEGQRARSARPITEPITCEPNDLPSDRS